VFGQLLITSLLVLLFSFEVPLKNIKKKETAKRTKNRKKKKKQETIEKGSCVCFFSFVRWSFVIIFVSRLVSLAQSILGPAYHHC
jgi:hypothetical protein